jgi:hypothetical protein
MTALAYFNQRVEAMLDGYQPDDELVPTALDEIVTRDWTPEGAANAVFELLNRDDRPNARFERSLSVGDVVRVDVPAEHDGATGYRVWLACETLGWRTIEEPS